MPSKAINSDVQKRRFALLLPAGYGETLCVWGSLSYCPGVLWSETAQSNEKYRIIYTQFL